MTIIRYTADELPKATPEELKKIDAIKDEDIDCSDIPELTETFWQYAEQGKNRRPKQQQVTVKIDADVLAWLKSQGKGYQTRLNAILRQSMLEKQ